MITSRGRGGLRDGLRERNVKEVCGEVVTFHSSTVLGVDDFRGCEITKI